MPQDLFLDLPTIAPQNFGVTLKKLTLEMAATNTPGKISLTLAPLDDQTGEWRSAVQPHTEMREDMLFSDDPAQRYAASAIHELMLTATVTDTPAHQALGVVGLSVHDAAKVILANELMGDNNG